MRPLTRRPRAIRAARTVGQYRLPRLDTLEGWTRLTNEDVCDMSQDELSLERRRLALALAMGGETLFALLWVVPPAVQPLTVGAWLRGRQRLVARALGLTSSPRTGRAS
jgi:hypothetical protein